MFASCNFLHFCCYCLDTFVQSCLIFDFTHLDTETTKLNLIVDSSKEFQFTFGIVSCQVTCAIHSTTLEHAFNKLLGCKILTLPITISYLISDKTQLSCHTQWH